MKKYLFLFIMILTTVGVLVACSGSREMNHDDMGEQHENMDEKDMDHDAMTEDEMDHESMSEDEMDHGSEHEEHGGIQNLKSTTGENELGIPVALGSEDVKNTVYTIRAQKGKTEIYKGVKTDTFGYNGAFMGPMLKFKTGEKVKINLVNELEQETTFHWHGLEVPADVDGGPHDTLKPGERRTIEFQIQQDAATLWFHPHPKGSTSEQVYKGLAGLIYVEDEVSTQLGLPQEYGVNDFPLIIQDKKFDEDSQLNYADAKNTDGTTGDTILINGTVNPKLTVRDEKVRLRLVNGSNARNFTFKLNTNEPFSQIATDGGLLSEPVTLTKLTLSPSERAEIIIDFSKLSEEHLSLVDDEGTDILQFHQSGEPGKETSLPGKMSSFSLSSKESGLPVSKRIELFGMMDQVTINGKKFNHDRIDFEQEKGVTEIWEIYNKPDGMGGMIHPFHIHGTQFKIVSRDGENPPKNEMGWKDSISIAPGETVKIAVKFEHEGIYMFHCHILEHEDNGMMGQIMVN